ncbi:MAG: hypothetical protein U1C46_04525 [Bacteroidales bacterium]|nr:hypothetical protein [Bacteroidales bacterium]MDZ4204067.1 hypothetical protein [Bacteroidales bacterium]
MTFYHIPPNIKFDGQGGVLMGFIDFCADQETYFITVEKHGRNATGRDEINNLVY